MSRNSSPAPPSVQKEKYKESEREKRKEKREKKEKERKEKGMWEKVRRYEDAQISNALIKKSYNKVLIN
jgi:hypothetical protein